VGGYRTTKSTGRAEAVAFALALLIVGTAQAQEASPGTLGVDHFGIDEGLPGTYIAGLAVSDDGLLWLIASGQLVSFDGFEFEEHDLARFPTDDPTLRTLAAGRADTVWVVVGQELFSYVRGRVHAHVELDGLSRGIWQEGDALWAWDDEGALLRQGPRFERVLRLGSGPTVETPPNLWLHPLEPGGARRFQASSILDPHPLAEPWPLPGASRRVLVSHVGESATEVTRLDGTPVTRIPHEIGRFPLQVDGRGLTWVARPGGLAAVTSTGELAHSLALAPEVQVRAVLEDHEGNLWVGTVTHGLYRVRALPVRTLAGAHGVTNGQVLRVSASPDGSVLLVEADGRVVRVTARGSETVYPAPGPDRVLGAMQDRRGTIWISLVDPSQGARLVGRTAEGDFVQVPGVRGFRLTEDPRDDGVLWASGAGQRVQPYAAAGPAVDVPALDRAWQARDMIVDSDGVVWITGPTGLARIGADRVEEWRVADGHRLAGGRALHRTDDGALWIGHYVDGLVRFRDGEFRQVTRADGLWDDGASTILRDDDDNLWMSSNRGVHRAGLAELNAFLDGDIDRVRGRGYGPGTGFRNPETSGWMGARDTEGRLWFPTFSGVAVIDPGAVLAGEHVPPGIRLRGVSTESARFAPDPGLVLPLGARRLDFAYGATLLSGHGGVRYEVLLEALDERWVDVGVQRQVTYGGVPPGEHVFRARAVSGAGVASVREATLTFTVPPHFYETATFSLLLVMTATGALWLLYHLRVRQLRGRELTLRTLVDERTAELRRAQAETQTAFETVEAQAAALRTLDEAKSRFFANVSHELRTPLMLVQGPLQDVLDGRLGPTSEPVREQVETVLASGRRLGELVEQLLDVAKLEAGELRLNVRREDLAPLFHRIAHAFGALARNRGIAFDTRLPQGSIVASVDSDQMEKVWANLLANALKFTRAGGRVTFAVEAGDGPDLVVTVEDDGPGISQEELPRIFERFHQVDASSRRVHGGTGLGLALVKEVTELHGGTVEVRSELSQGSRFVVRVPADAVVEPGVYPPAADKRPEPVRTESPGTPPPDTDDTERRTILVVEDNAELRAYLRRHLAQRYRVVEAENGRQGLEAARTAVPDLILCDIMMPEMDGEELCRAVRADPELAFLPVVMLTARWSRESRLSALEGGADDYLVKPFDPEELELRLRNLFAARERLAERALSFLPLERPGHGVGRDLVAQLEGVLRQNMADEDFGVDDMAKGMAMSRATLYRKTDELLGSSPMALLWGYRLTQAAHWLRNTDATVSEVAYGSGFKTVPHFTRRFRERFETTPAAWRAGPATSGRIT
jgi:signal transduction histidine kinase/CheY-like chemotaxis protein